MILTFDVPPLSRGQEPCDIDSSEKNQKYQKKLGSPGAAESIRL